MEVMNHYLLYILILIFGLPSAQVQYYIRQENTTAGLVAKECQLASPPIIYSKGGIAVVINSTEIQNLHQEHDGGTYWIGYGEELVLFLYKGCALPQNLNETEHTNLTEDPGQCFSKCKKNLIGIQETTCHCLSSLPTDGDLLESGCNSSCANPTGVLCGGKDRVSVYLKVQSFDQDISSKNACLSYNPRYRFSTWRNCLNQLQVKCGRGGGATNLLKTWGEAMQQCLSIHSLPGNLTTIQNSSEILWRPVIRSYSISIWEKSIKTTGSLAGYVELNNGRFELKFEDPGPTLSKYSLCEMQTSSLPPTSNPAMSTGSVALYTAIPVSLVVIAAVLFFILWRRGTLYTCKYTDGCISGKTSSTTANPTLESKPQSEAVQHDYFDLEPLGKYVSVKEDNKHDAKEDNYDKATIFSNEHDINNGYYDKATRSQIEFDNYDRATISPNGHDTNEEAYDKATRFTNYHGTYENNYDKAAGVTNAYDTNSNEYDKATTSFSKLPNNIISPDACCSLDNFGSYDHIGGIKRAVANSDDCYNHLERKKDENTYDTTSSESIFTQVIADDTYSKAVEK